MGEKTSFLVKEAPQPHSTESNISDSEKIPIFASFERAVLRPKTVDVKRKLNDFPEHGCFSLRATVPGDLEKSPVAIMSTTLNPCVNVSGVGQTGKKATKLTLRVPDSTKIDHTSVALPVT